MSWPTSAKCGAWRRPWASPPRAARRGPRPCQSLESSEGMGRILELLTVNVATRDLDGTLAKWRRLGLATLPPARMPEPPIEIVDVTLPLGPTGAISVIAPTGPGSAVQRFLD